MAQRMNLVYAAPPKFKAGLSDKEVNEGQNVEVEVKISGVPRPTLKWLVFVRFPRRYDDVHLR